ncbi:hypothetical protein [Nodosilinea sp. E11]|uniref:hypothetical protein n=1 Tax=Nodosilinea sp. E11 TaxID=3037479 RepID=UPI0029343803|nr:hypothetical protein [Nodosilinea sp. E11]WOD39909.1 hypothetical protein RRF56_03785 [Nodosilinea sp. E11]
MDDQIVQGNQYLELIDNPQLREYVQLAMQIAPIAHQTLGLVDKSLDLVKQLDDEKTTRQLIRENAENQRIIIERRMDQLDAELSADLESSKKVIDDSMRVFEWMVQNGLVDAAMIIHERVISMLSGRASIAAGKYNQNNPDGQVTFYTAEG